MSMGGLHYQILYHPPKKHGEFENPGYYGLHEVFRDENGKAFACTQDPEMMIPEDELGEEGIPATPEGAICKILQDMLKDASAAPIMNINDIPEDGAITPPLPPGIFSVVED